MRRLLIIALSGALLGLAPGPTWAQNLCSPSTAPLVRYPGYPGSTPYSGSTIQITSNCSGPNVDVGIRPDPYADLTFFLPSEGSYVPPPGGRTTIPLGIPIGGAVAPSSGSPFASYPTSTTTYEVPSGDYRPPAYPSYGWPSVYPGGYPVYAGYAAAPGYGGWSPYGSGYGYGYGYPGMAPYAAGYGVLPGAYPGWMPGGYPTYP